MNIYPFTEALGDSALIIHFGNEINEQVYANVMGLFNQLLKANLHGVIDIVPAYCSVTIHYKVTKVPDPYETMFDYYSDQVKPLIHMNLQEALSERIIRIPVCYSEKYGLDLQAISNQKNLPVGKIVEIHTSVLYKVYMLGFLPGFAYMGRVDERISVDRLNEPRPQVSAGSIGITGMQTAIYPVATPGGWQIIGRSPGKFFDKDLSEPVFLHPGDQVQFYSISEYEFENY